VASPSVLKEERGPEHCGWESATFLRYQRDWYVKDPQRALPPAEQPVGYTANAELPTDAVPTGFNSDGRELWISASTGGTAVFVVTPERTGRWPRLTAGCL
jgi:hypothetical protein